MSGWAWASNRISALAGRFELVTLEVSAFSGLGSCTLTTGLNFHNHWQTSIFACFGIWKNDNKSHFLLFLHHVSECLCGMVVKTVSRNRLWSNCLLHLPPRFLLLFRCSSFLFCSFNIQIFVIYFYIYFYISISIFIYIYILFLYFYISHLFSNNFHS